MAGVFVSASKTVKVAMKGLDKDKEQNRITRQ
jgi:hypothetical protein